MLFATSPACLQAALLLQGARHGFKAVNDVHWCHNSKMYISLPVKISSTANLFLKRCVHSQKQKILKLCAYRLASTQASAAQTITNQISSLKHANYDFKSIRARSNEIAENIRNRRSSADVLAVIELHDKYSNILEELEQARRGNARVLCMHLKSVSWRRKRYDTHISLCTLY